MMLRTDILQNCTQHKKSKHNDTQHSNTQNNSETFILALSVIKF